MAIKLLETKHKALYLNLGPGATGATCPATFMFNLAPIYLDIKGDSV